MSETAIWNIYVIDLESEMYQLSHLLIEQRNILAMLKEENMFNDAECFMAGNESGKLIDRIICYFMYSNELLKKST